MKNASKNENNRKHHESNTEQLLLNLDVVAVALREMLREASDAKYF